MGLRSVFTSVCSKVWSAVKTVCEKTVEVGKKAVSAVCNAAKKAGAMVKAGWEKFTGRNMEREAEELLAALEQKARDKEKEMREFSGQIQKRLDSALEQLNDMRADLNYNAFRRFEALASNFATWDVDKVRLELSAAIKEQHMERVKTRSELFKIDFRNNPVSSNVKAIFTLGFPTRKRAKETLLAVKEEESRLNYEIVKMDAEKKRLSLIAESLEQVVYFVAGCREYYNRILDELDYTVNFMRSTYSVMTGKNPPAQFDPQMLPEHHLLGFKCADQATRILFAIGNHRYISTEDKGVNAIADDFKSFKDGQKEMQKLQLDFAA